jgi:hypothetical protein
MAAAFLFFESFRFFEMLLISAAIDLNPRPELPFPRPTVIALPLSLQSKTLPASLMPVLIKVSARDTSAKRERTIARTKPKIKAAT